MRTRTGKPPQAVRGSIRLVAPCRCVPVNSNVERQLSINAQRQQRVGSRPPRTVRGPAHGGLSPARCGPPPFLLNSHSEGRSTQSAVGLSNSCSLNQEWVPSFNANPPRIGGCILQLDQTSPQVSTGSCRERVHRKQQVRSSPVVPRHDPLHELIEHRHREGGVAVIGAPDHALGDQGAACRSQ